MFEGRILRGRSEVILEVPVDLKRQCQRLKISIKYVQVSGQSLVFCDIGEGVIFLVFLCLQLLLPLKINKFAKGVHISFLLSIKFVHGERIFLEDVLKDPIRFWVHFFCNVEAMQNLILECAQYNLCKQDSKNNKEMGSQFTLGRQHGRERYKT